MSALSGGCPRSPRCWRCCSSPATAEIVLDGAAGHSPLIPKSPAIAGWLAGIGERLGYRVFLIALLVSRGAYAVLLVARAPRSRRARSPNAGRSCSSRCCTLIVFVGPILISTDVFSYIAYARMGVEHGLNPYTARPGRDRARPGLPVRRARLDARRHRLRPALHAALLPARAARRDGRAVGDEARGAARERRHARAHLALRARARPRPGARDPRRRRQPAVRDLRRSAARTTT